MPRALKPCSASGCSEPVKSGRCPTHVREAEQRRGTARQRGYDQQHGTLFKRAVLAKHPTCQCDQPDQHGHGQRCTRRAQHADHWPLDRRTLVEQGMDPNDPRHGRGLCHSCHSGETARLQPGGWANRLT